MFWLLVAMAELGTSWTKVTWRSRSPMQSGWIFGRAATSALAIAMVALASPLGLSGQPSDALERAAAPVGRAMVSARADTIVYERADTTPSRGLVLADVEARRVDCVGGPSCWVAKSLLRLIEVDRPVPVLLQSVESTVIKVDSIQLVAIGQTSEGTFSRTEKVGWSLPPGFAGFRRIHLPDTLGPDRYDGLLRAFVEEPDTVFVAPARIYVRSGPILPALLLLLGLLVGRLTTKLGKPEEGDEGIGAGKRRWFWFSGLGGIKTAQKPPNGLATVLAGLSGVAWPNQEDTGQHALRSFLGIVTVVALVTEGWRLLYLGDPSFGAGGPIQWAAVVVWAFASDVAQRFLANLQWPEEA